jgi:peptidoglycan/xylan/chitin deacetylase (PgdA/CDA1 family)
VRSVLERSIRILARESLGTLRLLKPGPSGSARIIYYHRISDDDHRSCVAPAAFSAQMRLLRAEAFRVVPLRDLRAHLDKGLPFPDRTVAVTFDDGFADNYSAAFPVLQHEGIPATIFLTAAFIDGPELPVLRDRSGVPPLRWAQVREMARHGIAFGGHTLTHPELPSLSDEELRHEVQGARELIEDRLGTTVDTFCYPRGKFDTRVKAAVRDAGYVLACTTLPGCVTPKTHPFSLRRTFIARDDSARDFAHKLAGTFDLLHAARQRLASTSTSTGPEL